MNSWLLIRRLRGPAFLILVGINALLNQWGVLSFNHSWPFYLILAGILGLAERAALAAAPPVNPGYPGYPGYPAYTAPGYVPPPYASAAPGSFGQNVAPAAGTGADPLVDPDRRS